MVAQLYMIVSTCLGLTSQRIMKEIAFDTPKETLLEYLNQEQGMHLEAWFIFLIGLMALDVGVIKYLPWGDLITRTSVQRGVPRNHFIEVAFVASLIEDMSQIALQIAFIVSIDEDDGWAIIGAMASMTLYIADIMVKFVSPMVVKLFASNKTHPTREHALARVPK